MGHGQKYGNGSREISFPRESQSLKFIKKMDQFWWSIDEEYINLLEMARQSIVMDIMNVDMKDTRYFQVLKNKIKLHIHNLTQSNSKGFFCHQHHIVQ